MSVVATTSGIVFRRWNQGRLKLTGEASNRIHAFVQDKPDKLEAGGVLLGRLLNESNDVIIDLVTIPQPNDKRRRYRFFRKHRAHQAIIDKVWKESDGAYNYLGEWHTHPEATPVPSQIDLKSWQKQMQNAQFEGDSLFFIIFGTINIRVFEIIKGENIVRVLSPDNDLEQ